MRLWRDLAVLVTCALAGGLACSDKEYLDNQKLMERLDKLTTDYPELAAAYTIGVSARGVELRVLKLSALGDEASVPQVKLVGGIHGNEPPPTHILVNFAEYLLRAYRSKETYATWLLNNTRIHVLPRLNPDGFSMAPEGECKHSPGRRNFNDVDLNRGFPTSDDTDLPPILQPEVQAVIEWSEHEKFTLSASLHTGALVAVYPLDSPLGGEDTTGKTPDEDVFRHLAKTYASNHHTMTSGIGCGGHDHFREGIINGAEWYRASGTMMDYNYLYAGTMELTLELHCCKYPPPHILCPIWEQNKLSLMKIVGEAVRGVRGKVTSNGIPLENAVVKVLDRDMPVYTNSRGQFFRVLLPGRYFLEVEMVGMASKLVSVDVKRPDTAFLTWTEVNIDLVPEGGGPIETKPWTVQPNPRTPLYDRGGLDPETVPTQETYTPTDDWWSTEEYGNEDQINDTSILTRRAMYNRGGGMPVEILTLFVFLSLLLIVT